MKIKRIFTGILILMLVFSLASCSKGITKGEATDEVETFLENVSNGDFDKASAQIHPTRAIGVEYLFNMQELRMGVDFQSGIEIKRYTSLSSSYYDSEVDGSDFDVEMEIIVSGKTIGLEIEIVKNDEGYGIYSVEFDD